MRRTLCSWLSAPSTRPERRPRCQGGTIGCAIPVPQSPADRPQLSSEFRSASGKPSRRAGHAGLEPCGVSWKRFDHTAPATMAGHVRLAADMPAIFILPDMPSNSHRLSHDNLCTFSPRSHLRRTLGLSVPGYLCFQSTQQTLGGHPQGAAFQWSGIEQRRGNRQQEPSNLTNRELRVLGLELLQGLLVIRSEPQKYRSFCPRQWEPSDRFVLDP
jgi:hypothetical protein